MQEKISQSNRKLYTKPISITAKLITFFLRLSGLRYRLQKDLGKDPVNHRHATMPKSFSRSFDVSKESIIGNNVWLLGPKKGESKKTILFLHGGAYIYGIQNIYWGFFKELIEKTNASVIVPEYPLAPENKAEDVYPFLDVLYEWVLKQTDPSDLILMGDSAGGGMGLGFSMLLRDANRPLPSHLVLLCPWIDISLDNPKTDEKKESEIVVTKNGLKSAGKAFAGAWDTHDFRLSPIYGNLDGLPELTIFSCVDEVFYPDCEMLYSKCVESDLVVNYFVYPKLFHEWMVVYPKMKEGQDVLMRIKDLCFDH